jgi:plasmid stability protein
MMVRTQIALKDDTHRRAKRRAAERGVSLAEYVRQTLDADLGEEPKGDISGIVGLFSSGGSNIAKHKEQYLNEAAWEEHLRSTGQLPR